MQRLRLFDLLVAMDPGKKKEKNYWNKQTNTIVSNFDAEDQNQCLALPCFNEVYIRHSFFEKMGVTDEQLLRYGLNEKTRFQDIFEPIDYNDYWTDYLRRAHFLSEDAGFESEYYEFSALMEIDEAKKWCAKLDIDYDEAGVDDWG